MAEAVEILRELTGSAPLGWYTGRDSPHTRELVVEHGGFVYDSDSYADDLPYWVRVGGTDHLVVPYTLDTNDMRFASPPGFANGDEFFAHLRDAFDVLYAEGVAGQPEDAVGGAALPARRAAGARRGTATLPRPRAGARPRVDPAPHRDRRALAHRSPGTNAFGRRRLIVRLLLRTRTAPASGGPHRCIVDRTADQP